MHVKISSANIELGKNNIIIAAKPVNGKYLNTAKEFSNDLPALFVFTNNGALINKNK